MKLVGSTTSSGAGARKPRARPPGDGPVAAARDGASCGIIVQNASGAVIYANAAAAAILGVRPRDLAGPRAASALRLRREDGTPVALAQQPAAVVLRTGRPVRGAVLAVDRPGGAPARWVQITAVPVPGAGARSARVVSTLVDVTARRRASLAEQVCAAVDAADDALLLLDGGGRLVHASVAARALFDLRPGAPVWDQLPASLGARLRAECARAAAARARVEIEAPHPAHRAWLHVRVQPASDGLAVWVRVAPGPRSPGDGPGAASARRGGALLATAVRELCAPLTALRLDLERLARRARGGHPATHPALVDEALGLLDRSATLEHVLRELIDLAQDAQDAHDEDERRGPRPPRGAA